MLFSFSRYLLPNHGETVARLSSAAAVGSGEISLEAG